MSSLHRDGGNHAPLTPSRLWQSHEPGTSPEDRRIGSPPGSTEQTTSSPSAHTLEIDDDGVHPTVTAYASSAGDSADTEIQGGINEPSDHGIDAHTKLLKTYDRAPGYGAQSCNHGTFSPRPGIRRSEYSFGGRYDGGIGNGPGESSNRSYGILGDAVMTGFLGAKKDGERQMSTMQWLAKTHGIKNPRAMYVDLMFKVLSITLFPVWMCMVLIGECLRFCRYLAYYFPFMNWVIQYKWAYLKGDVIAALTMASFYIPMSLSYASNLGHIPPINGLYSFVFNPLIYAFLGTCPQMVVGPEAAGSLLVGSVVRDSVDAGHSGDEDGMMHARIAGVVTGMAGAIIFIAGLTRLGFLESVLSRPFLRGFISAIGFVILVDQLIPEMGLTQRAKEVGGVSHGSSLNKLIFLFTNLESAHGLTCGVALGSFAIIMVCR